MIVESQAKVYHSPITRRRYLSRKAAIRATARALILARFPTEKAEYDNIGCTYSGFHWTAMPRADVLYRRVVRLVTNAAAPPTEQERKG